MDTEVNIPCWETESYQDEQGFRQRISYTIPGLAAHRFQLRSRSVSTCPDAGLRVYSWALEGEDVISPYSGRLYKQGKTGYFGPKERDEKGRISRFGGDPLKHDLPPVIARLLLDPDDQFLRAFVATPGNLRQQYHFAAVNWARFFPLLADKMDENWREEFARAIAEYREDRRPSDGNRENAAELHSIHDLVGEDRWALGGDPVDGGTENHKVMWRTSGLLYAQLLGPDATISRIPAPRAEQRITGRLTDFLYRLLTVGNGEYDSSIYYMHSIVGLLNLYDFSPKPETKALAKAILDYYFATYGLKLFNGTLIGAEKRGFDSGPPITKTGLMMWMYAPESTYAVPPEAIGSIHQATTSYRPNSVIANIMKKKVALPFEARMARPAYHMDQANEAQESFYCHGDFALGSVAMTGESNPQQQTIWSLGTRGPEGTLVFGGVQPRFRSPCGHSPHDQVLQKRSALILVTGPEAREPANKPLELLPDNISPAQRWNRAHQAAETWVYAPKQTRKTSISGDWLLCDGYSAYAAFRCLGGRIVRLELDTSIPNMGKLLARYDVFALPGAPTGFVLEVGSAAEFESLESFANALEQKTRLDASRFKDSTVLSYRSLAGDTLDFRYQPDQLRCAGRISGVEIDWDNWAGGNVYQSPYCTIGHGRMSLSDGVHGYAMHMDTNEIRYRDARNYS